MDHFALETNQNILKSKNMGYLQQIEEYLHDFKDTLTLLIENIGSCITEMTTIADELDKFHRGATIASVTGSSLGITGGIATIVGLALAPVTLGASLIVSGVGIGVAVAGGVTGASASIADTINMKKKSQRVQELIDQINEMMAYLKEISENINLKVVNLQCRSDGDELLNLARVVGRGALSTMELSRISQLGKITAVASRGAQLATRGVQAAAAISGVLAALFIILDAVFIIKGAVDLHKGSKTEEAARIRECAAELQLIYQDADNLFQDLKVFF
ncbi:apolipoprotein L3-like [Bufo gargarizans]|uniref:apolipoprotein L3-like n=1 Tax=Bufo gargarizans TaxID=30331 RepID=UPI001CF442BD|nr:apolipoprotein L3-like [Bufo gargarizans]XP_044146680.1 apolipoprotein L3-like [Bufo gargarizans]